jgi:succinate dehydrogenase / fumarate reductase cytochrome b subunit
MNVLLRIWRSSLGKKYVMAVTGLGLFIFVIAHMAGNLQIFLGPEKINAYAYFLKANPGFLWTARLGLLLIAVLHVTAALQLALANRAARPVRYEEGKPTGASFASRTILLSGLVILAFVIYHLMHFTFGVTNPDFLQLRDPLTAHHDVYRMMIQGFSNVWVSTFYIIAMGLLCLHLSHGVVSMFQSVGLRSQKYARFLSQFAKFAAVAIFIGNCSIPVAVLTGMVE